MSKKRFSRHVLLSSCCFSAAVLVSALPANATDYPVTSGTQVVTAPITGTDTLTKTTSGTYIVTAPNTSTGTTTISAGTLQIGATVLVNTGNTYDTTAAIASTSIVNSGTLTFNRGDGINAAAPSYTYAGVISGTGALKQIGYGTVILTGNNTYTGVTTLTTTSVTVTNPDASTTTTAYGANLQIGNGGTSGWVGSSSIVVGSNSVLTFNRSDNVVWAGVISSSGGVTQAGSGTLTFTGVNTVSGSTTINAGTLALSGTGALAASAIVNNATFDVSGVTAASVTLKSLASTVTTANSAVVIAGAKNLILTSGATYGGTISGTGTYTQSGGTQVFSNDSTAFTGAITIASGATLQYGSSTTTGSLRSLSTAITDNGTFALARFDNIEYTGLISGTGGVKQAGPGVLTLNIINAYTGTTSVSGGTLVIGDASHTTASVAGAASVTGGTLTGYGTITGALTNGGTVRVGYGSVGNLTVGGAYTQTGTFTSEISPTAASVLRVGGAATLGGTFSVVAEAGDYGQFAYTAPVLTASSVTGSFTTSTGVSGNVAYGVTYPSATTVSAVVVPAASGQIYGDVITETLENTHVLNDIVIDHTAFNRCDDKGPTCNGVSLWAQGLAGTSHVDASNGAMAFNGHSWGMIAGLGYNFMQNGSVNLAVAYSGHNVGVNGGGSSADTNGLYSSLTLHAGGPVIGLDLNAFYVGNKTDISRDTGFGLASSQLVTTGGGIAAQFTAPLLGGDLTPLAKATYAFLSYGPATETGTSGVNLQSLHGKQTTAYYDVGVRLSHLYVMDGGFTLKPHLYAGLQVNGTEGVPPVSMSVIYWTNTNFSAPSATLSKFSGVFRLGVDAKLDNALSLHADFDGKYGARQQQGIFSLGASYRF